VSALEEQRVALLLEQLVEDVAGVQVAARREASRVLADEVDVGDRSPKGYGARV
jgi:hypothetical protein